MLACAGLAQVSLHIFFEDPIGRLQAAMAAFRRRSSASADVRAPSLGHEGLGRLMMVGSLVNNNFNCELHGAQAIVK